MHMERRRNNIIFGAKMVPKIDPKTLCFALGARFRARSTPRRVQERSCEPPGTKKKHWMRPGAPQGNFPAISCPPQNRQPPRGGGSRRVLPLHFGSLFLKIAAGASAGCKNRGVQGFRGHSWGWGEKLKLLQQQASLLFKASLREA